MKFRYNKKNYIFNNHTLYVDDTPYKYMFLEDLDNNINLSKIINNINLSKTIRNELLTKPYLSLLYISDLGIFTYVFHDKALSDYHPVLFKYEVLSTIELNEIRSLKEYKDIYYILEE